MTKKSKSRPAQRYRGAATVKTSSTKKEPTPRAPSSARTALPELGNAPSAPKSAVLYVRLSEPEHELLVTASKIQRRTLAGWTRRLLLEAAAKVVAGASPGASR